MLKKKLIAATAVLGLASAPVVAQVSAPQFAPVDAENELGGGSAGIIAGALILGIVAMAVLAFADDDDDSPISV